MALKITQIRSSVGAKKNQRDTLRSLGLKRPNNVVVRPDTPVVRGYIQAVRHMVVVEEVAGE